MYSILSRCTITLSGDYDYNNNRLPEYRNIADIRQANKHETSCRSGSGSDIFWFKLKKNTPADDPPWNLRFFEQPWILKHHLNQGPSFFQVDSFIFYPGCVGSSTLDEVRNQGCLPLLGTNISHQWDRKLIFPTAFGWDMLVPRRVESLTSKNNPVASYAKHYIPCWKSHRTGYIRVSR